MEGQLFERVLRAPRSELQKFVVGRAPTKSVVGVPFIGKSTLAFDTKRWIEEQPEKRFCVYLTLQALSNDVDFYRSFHNEICRELRRNDVPFKADFTDSDSRQQIIFRIREILESVWDRFQIPCIVMLDHFDSIADLEGGKQVIHQLRELVDRNREHGARFVFFSRQELADIEMDVTTSSIFGVARNHTYIKPASTDLNGSSSLDATRLLYAGGHPYIFDLLVNVPEDEFHDTCVPVYEKMLGTFSLKFSSDDPESLELSGFKLFDKMIRLGLISRTADHRLAFFCAPFGEYFRKWAVRKGAEILLERFDD
jgi:hypothetical protein